MGACRLSYVEGRLKLAEKERQRALKAKEAVPENGVSQEELAALNAKADANMAALLQEEAALKASLLLRPGFHASAHWCNVQQGCGAFTLPCGRASTTLPEHMHREQAAQCFL